MARFHTFSTFSSLYEAEGDKEKPYLTLLKQILSYIDISYTSQQKLTEDPYDGKIIPDLDSVLKAPGVDSYRKILANVKSAVDASDPAGKAAGEAWSNSGEKFVVALGIMLDKLKDNKESLDAANKSISDFIETQKQNLEKSSKDNALKKEIETERKKNESFYYSDLNENIFTGKKGTIKDISKEITRVRSNLENMKGIPGMEEEVKKYQDEVSKIEDEMKTLVKKKNKEISKDDLKKASARLAEIPSLLAKKSGDLAKEDTANKEAAAAFAEGIKSLEAANSADKAYVEKMEISAKEEKAWNDSAKSTIGFKGTVKMDDVKGKKNSVVAGFQKQVIDKFKSVLKNSDTFKKFSEGKFAGDGFFGPNTAKVVQGVKAGFGMDDKSSDITDEFLNKVYSYVAEQKQNESQTFGRIQSFTSFENINEAKLKFDTNKFLKTVGEDDKAKKGLPSPQEIYDSLKKEVEEIYSQNKGGIDYLMGKDFEPTKEGERMFRTLFRASWNNFKGYTDQQKKNTLTLGIKTILAPKLGMTKGIDKEILDIYLKAKDKK